MGHCVSKKSTATDKMSISAPTDVSIRAGKPKQSRIKKSSSIAKTKEK